MRIWKAFLMIVGGALFVLIGCEGGGGIKLPEQCAWQGECPQNWTPSGNTCVYEGETISIEGTVKIYSLGTPVANAVVKIYDFDTLLPPCGVSDSDGHVKIDGIPVGTDVTVEVLAPGAFNGKPTYYFHFLTAERNITGEEFVFISQFLGNTILGLLQPYGVGGLEEGEGAIAGAVELPDGTYPDGATVIVVSGSTVVPSLYLSFAGFPPSITNTGTFPDSGVYVTPKVPAGHVEVRVYLPDSSNPYTFNAVVYDGAISIVGTRIPQ